MYKEFNFENDYKKEVNLNNKNDLFYYDINHNDESKNFKGIKRCNHDKYGCDDILIYESNILELITGDIESLPDDLKSLKENKEVYFKLIIDKNTNKPLNLYFYSPSNGFSCEVYYHLVRVFNQEENFN